MSYRSSIVSGLTICVALIGAIIWYSTSPWVMWQLLPTAADQRIVLAPQHPIIQHAEPLLDQYLADTEEAIRHSYRSGIARQDAVTTIVVLPTLATQRNTANTLRRDGWHVQRLGLLIRAQRGGTQQAPTTQNALLAAAKNIALQNTPMRPALIAHGQLLPDQPPLMIIGTATKTTLNVLTIPDVNAPLPHLVPPTVASDVQLQTRLPGHILRQLPQPLHNAWETALRQRLQFTNTTPPLLEYLSQFTDVTITITNSDVAITVSGATAAAKQTMTQWVQDEERSRRPTQQPFRLPDGTIGYEEVPGDPVAIFQTASDTCDSPIAGRTTLWLCHTETDVTLATNAALATSPQSTTTNWYLASHPTTTATCTNESSANNNALCKAIAIRSIGTTTETVTTIDFATP